MFKVLKGLRGNGNICMLMRVVTDNVFDIRSFFFFFAFLSMITKCWSFWLPFTNITGITSISDYQHMVSACRFQWCLILQMTTNPQLAIVQHKLTAKLLKVHMLLLVIITDLYSTVWGYCNICWALISDPSLLTCDSVSVLCMFSTLYKM